MVSPCPSLVKLRTYGTVFRPHRPKQPNGLHGIQAIQQSRMCRRSLDSHGRRCRRTYSSLYAQLAVAHTDLLPRPRSLQGHQSHRRVARYQRRLPILHSLPHHRLFRVERGRRARGSRRRSSRSR
ncbi:hypothetical protein BKA81DRAFT_7439 [Phyllosticta paracitricarpa]